MSDATNGQEGEEPIGENRLRCWGILQPPRSTQEKGPFMGRRDNAAATQPEDRWDERDPQ